MMRANQFLTNPKLLVFCYVLLYLTDSLTECLFRLFLRLPLALLYLWTLYIFVYNTFFTRKYLKSKYYILCQVFLAINVLFSFRFPVNFRFSILQDFASLVFMLFICFDSFSDGNRKDLDRLLYMYFFITMIMSFASVIGIWAHVPVTHFDGTGYDKVRGFYHGYNDACFLAYLSIITSVYFLAGRKRILKEHTDLKPLLFNACCIFNIVFQCILIYIIQSRSTLLGLTLSMLIIVLYNISKALKLKTSYVILLCFFAAAAAVYIIVFSKYGPDRNIYYFMLSHNYSSLSQLSGAEITDMFATLMSGRFALWNKAIEIIKTSPILGYGLKSAGFTHELLTEGFSNTHNLFLNSMLYSGIIGTVSLLSILGHVFRDIIPSHSKENIILISYIFGLFLSSLLDPCVLYNWRAVNAVFWVFSGFLAHSVEKVPEQ